MGSYEVALMIFGMAVVTYLPRALPLVLLSNRDLPKPLRYWLTLVPVGVLAALLGASLTAKEGALALCGFDLRLLIVTVPTAAIAIRHRSIFGTVAVGVASLALLRWLWP